MASKTKESVDQFYQIARKMYFSSAVIDRFLEKASASEVKALTNLIEDELDVRKTRKIERLFRKAAFPQVKSLDGYDFTQVAFPEGYTAEDLLTLDFIENAQDFVFYGQTGRGKTHLAVAIGIAAVNSGKRVRYFTASMLVLALIKARDNEKLSNMLNDLAKCDLLIVDELGYLPIGVEGGRLLFQVMSDCYEKRSLIITTNIEFSKWGTILGDDKLAAALIDRIVHHGRMVEFGGASKRMDKSLMLGNAEE